MKFGIKINRKGFSLIEMVAATTILSLGVVSICAMTTRGLSQVKSNRGREIAWDMLDRQLMMIDYMGIDEFIEAGETSGVMGDESSAAGSFAWQVHTEETETVGLINVSIVVSWGTERNRKSVVAQTMLISNEMIEEAEAEAEAAAAEEAEQGNG